MDFSKHTDKFSVKVNKTALGQVTYYRVERATNQDATSYIVEIRRRVANTPERETVNFYTPDNFNVTFVRAGLRITFVNCTVVNVSEEIGEDRLIYETVKFTAQGRGVTDADNPDNPFEELE